MEVLCKRISEDLAEGGVVEVVPFNPELHGVGCGNDPHEGPQLVFRIFVELPGHGQKASG